MVPLWHVHSCALLLVMLPRRVADPRSAKPPLGALPFRVWFMKGWGLSLVPFLFSNFHFLVHLWTLSDLFCFLRPLPAFRMLSHSVFRGQLQKGSRCEFRQSSAPHSNLPRGAVPRRSWLPRRRRGHPRSRSEIRLPCGMPPKVRREWFPRTRW